MGIGIEKMLGKIVRVEFGQVSDYPFLFGIQYEFLTNGWSVCGSDVVNTNIEAHGKGPDGQALMQCRLGEMLYRLIFTMNEARVSSVEKLVGIPVEVTYENNQFKSFRILKEVI
ncbi:MAG: hypothetical protein BWY08_00034 [Bacteroidetes bacterium ADurb.Bin174]|nr:MAG: hypothetical protein BWY08_00034 [Bacteroidetes bacterium ADurb.Bin174]